MSKPQKVGLLLLLTLFLVLRLYARVFAQKVYDDDRTSSPEAGTLVESSFLDNSYHFSIRQENWTAASSRPSRFIKDVIVSNIVSSPREPSDVADGRYGNLGFQGKSYKGSKRPRGVLCCVEHDNGNIFPWYALTGEGIFYQIADSQINSGVALATTESKELEAYVVGKLSPGLIWNIDSRETNVGFLNGVVPAIEYMTVCDESPIGINKKTTSSDERNLKIIVLVVIATDDGDDRATDGLYCFDGDGFIPSPTVNGKQKKCDDSKFPHGGASGVISDHLTKRAIP
jgi:hypothetical protein